MSAAVGGISTERLTSLVQRVERLHAERKVLGDDIRDIFAEAKSAGFDPKALKVVIARRRMEEADKNELDTLVELYTRALAGA